MKRQAIAGLPRPVAEVVLGTLELWRLPEGDVFRLLDEAAARGVDLIDTARKYGEGASEALIGRWLRSAGVAGDGPMILTKGCHHDGPTRRVTAAALEADIAESLEALGRDRIDLFMFHRDDPRVPVGEIVEWIDGQVTRGTVRAWGVSNWTAVRVERALDYAERTGRRPPAAVSNHLCLAAPREPMWPGCEDLGPAARAWHRRHDLPHLAWSPLGRGFFEPATARWRGCARGDVPEALTEIARVYFGRQNWARYDRARLLARERDATLAQVALAYALAQPFRSLAIVGAENWAELREAVAAAELELSDAERGWLEAGAPDRPPAGGLLAQARRLGDRLRRLTRPIAANRAQTPPTSAPAERGPVVEPEVGSSIGEAELAAVARVVRSGQSLTWGDEVERFEADLCAVAGARHAVATSSCTQALALAAQLLRLGPDDEVVCTPQSFWATASALRARGVGVRFADVDPLTLNINPASLARCLTPATRAIYLVHYGGLPAELSAIRAIARARGVTIVEDCAHALGASAAGTPIGDGDLCCFSFGSLKNITALGGGGALCTGNPAWRDEARQLRNWGTLGLKRPRVDAWRFGPHGRAEVFDNAFDAWEADYLRTEEVGGNHWMTSVEAAVGRVQLGRLPALIARRRAIAERYDQALAGHHGVELVPVPPGARHAQHLYTFFVDPAVGHDRNGLVARLKHEHGVEACLRYWPLHLHPAFRELGHGLGDCPVCETAWFERQIGLPLSPTLTDNDVERVVEALGAVLEERQGS